MANKIVTFAYEKRWGGGYGWIITRPDGTGIDSSEKSSATRDRAIAAAKRWAKRNQIEVAA